MADLLITHGSLITMNPNREVIEDGAIAIERNRIIEIGRTADLITKHKAPKVIDAKRMVVMPGLIDGHAHAGHGLIRALCGEDWGTWGKACEKIYAEGTTEVLEMAQRESEAMLDRMGLRDLLKTHERFWGHAQYPWIHPDPASAVSRV